MSSSHYVLLLVKANLHFNKYHHHSTFYYYHWLYCFLTCRTDSSFKKVYLKLTLAISIQNHSSPFFLIRSFSFLSKITAPLSFQIAKETSNTPDLSKKCRNSTNNGSENHRRCSAFNSSSQRAHRQSWRRGTLNQLAPSL